MTKHKQILCRYLLDFIPFNFLSIINVGAHRKTFPNKRAIIAYKASGSSAYILECPNINGGFTMKIIPANTSTKLRISLKELRV